MMTDMAAAVAHWLDGAWPVQPLYDADHAWLDVPAGATAAQVAVLLAEVAAHGCYYDHAGRQWRLPRAGDRVMIVRGP